MLKKCFIFYVGREKEKGGFFLRFITCFFHKEGKIIPVKNESDNTRVLHFSIQMHTGIVFSG